MVYFQYIAIFAEKNENGKKAKIELCPNIKLVYNHGLKEQEVKKAMEICNMYKEEFIQEWHRRFD